MVENENVINADVVENSAEAEVTENPKPPSTKALWFGLLAVLLISAGGIANLYKKQKTFEAEFKATMLENKKATSQDVYFKHKFATLETRIGEYSNKLNEIISKQKNQEDVVNNLNTRLSNLDNLEVGLGAVRAEIKSLKDRLNTGVSRHVLIKARSIIEDAISAATINGDLKQSGLLFKESARVLKSTEEPQLIAASEKLLEVGTTIASAYVPDTTRIIKDIDALIIKVDALEFIGEADKKATPKQPAIVKEFSVKNVASSIWSDVRSLVKISKDESEYITIASTEAKQSYRSALALKLEQIRLLAQNYNQPGFDATLASALELLNRVFDANATAVKNFKAELEKLMQLKVTPEDVSQTLATARAIVN